MGYRASAVGAQGEGAARLAEALRRARQRTLVLGVPVALAVGALVATLYFAGTVEIGWSIDASGRGAVIWGVVGGFLLPAALAYLPFYLTYRALRRRTRTRWLSAATTELGMSEEEARTTLALFE